ncbi:CDC16 protein [Massospora cicadina]|nr:CDC16 protein [Massospora cicadina]
MFARPQRKKRSHGSNFSSSIGEEMSLGVPPISIPSRFNAGFNLVNGGTGVRIIRKVQSNSALSHPTPNCTSEPVGGIFATAGQNAGPRAPRFQLSASHPAQGSANFAHQQEPFFSQPLLPSRRVAGDLNRSNSTPASLHNSLNELRIHILKFGLPNEDSTMEYPVSNSIRCKVWKALLGVYHLSAGEYLQFVAKGPSPMFEKVNNDTFRTLATDKKFLARVQESMLVRVLNAHVWKTQSGAPGTAPTYSEYVQDERLGGPLPFRDAGGGCVLLLPTLAGVHCGLKLMDRCLEVLDAELYFYLKSKGLTSELYAFASVLTLSASMGFLLAFGVHLNVVCVVAQLMLIRQSLLSSPSPVKLLRTFPDLQAVPIIQLSRYLVKQLPAQLYEELVAHPFDASVCDRYLNERLPDLYSPAPSLFARVIPPFINALTFPFRVRLL